jgi:multiple sugar transport system ATP-binding protein
MATLVIENLSKNFGKTAALRDVSLAMNDSEFLILLGPTGAGKTTTLRCVAGLEKPDHGQIRMDGQLINGLTPAERDVAFVFQSYALYPRKTVFDNMAFPLEARKLSKTEIEQRVTEIARKLAIDSLLKRRPAALSGGQQQRVALGRAMVRQPRLFLMDEPLTNLDFKLRVEMRAELKRLQTELAATFFYVTNDQVEAMSMADRIAILNHGVLQQIDTPENIYNHPANLFVAGFVGSPRMNFLECQIDKRERVIVGKDRAWRIPLTNNQFEMAARGMSGDAYIFGIRPEDVELSTENAANTAPASLYVVEPLGDRTIVDLRLGSEIVKAKVSPDFAAASGDGFGLRFDPERFHVFEKSSGAVII